MRKLKVRFEGELEKQYEATEVYAGSARQLLKMLFYCFPGFKQEFLKRNTWALLLTNPKTGKETFLNNENFDLDIDITGYTDLVVAPVVKGATGIEIAVIAGVSITLGHVLVAVSLIATIVSMAMALTASTPKMDSPTENNGGTEPSFLFNGAPNTNEPGYPIPLVYGVTLTTPTVISAGLHSRRKG